MQIAPLTATNVESAAKLLAERFVEQRDLGLPWPGATGDPSMWRPQLQDRLARGAGLVAFTDDGPTAFICAREERSSPWLPSYWIDFDMHAAALPEAYRDLYAAAAEWWVERGCLDHYVVAPVLDDVVAIWFALGFGLEQVYGIRSLATEIAHRRRVRASITRATVEDLPSLLPLIDTIARYQSGSPVFGINLAAVEDFEEGHRELLERADCHYWLASVDDRVAGYAVFVPIGADEPHLPSATIELHVAAVADEMRGTGVGGALTSAGLRGARDAGFEYCVTDWRSANPLSSRMWTRWDFQPWAYRLHRTIDRRFGPRGEPPEC
ncbi:MAG: GNAT family N-acetyltransferase [Actinomycetota bacterium]|nr:GNAT family N-acetyltransferase [Actinomycetota bacterium]